MDKRYIKLNGELVEIVSMEVADSKFATIKSPHFTGSGTIESTDKSNDKSLVNLGYLKGELSNVDTRYDEVGSNPTKFSTTLDEISKVSSVKSTDNNLVSISLDPSSVTSYPGLVDSQNRVDNSRAGIIAIEGVKLLMDSVSGSGGVQDSITEINNDITEVKNDITEINNNISENISNVRNEINEVNTNLSNEISNVRNEINNVNESLTKNINDLTTSFQSEINKVQTDITSLNSSYNSLKSSVDTINTNISNINKSINDIKSQLEADLTEIRESISLLNTKLTTLELNTNS